MTSFANAGRPLISVCIPAYNRAALMVPLLDSIAAQSFRDYEVVVCENDSPERDQIRQVVLAFSDKCPAPVRYYENEVNLGYDGNIRRLVDTATGRYCLFMGNDDLLCPGSLAYLADRIQDRPEAGVVVRSYASFEADPAQPTQVFRYFGEETYFDPGGRAVVMTYRRSVVVSGLVIFRDLAAEIRTNQFDGTLLYQIYLSGMIARERGVLFVPKIIALRRDGTAPDFGSSEIERSKYVPTQQTSLSSLHFMRGMLEIARFISRKTSPRIYRRIRADIGNYSYPILSIQSKKSLIEFVGYSYRVGKLGIWRSPYFYLYFFMLFFAGSSLSERIIISIKSIVGHTPLIGSK